MAEETGIMFQYQPGQEDCYGEASIMFVYMAPWYYNEIERNITADALNKIMKKYMVELGIDGKPDDLAIEYYG